MATTTPRVFTGAIALIKVNGQVVGKMRSVRVQENIQRTEVRGLGTIIPDEVPATTWAGTLTCDQISISFINGGIPGGINRNFKNAVSQVLNGAASFEDQLVLDDQGVQVDLFKKVSDVIDSNGIIKPTLIPFVSVKQCFIDSDSLEVAEGGLAGHNQSYRYIQPILDV